MNHLHLIQGAPPEDDQVARLNAFLARHPGAEVTRPSSHHHPFELRVPEPDGDRVLVAYRLGDLMDKADRHYPAAGTGG